MKEKSNPVPSGDATQGIKTAITVYFARFINMLMADTTNPMFTDQQRQQIILAANTLQKFFKITEMDLYSQRGHDLVAEFLASAEGRMEVELHLAAEKLAKAEKASKQEGKKDP